MKNNINNLLVPDTRISVVIPTYNRSALLLRAVKSVLNQTLPAHEIIVCDDGSTDNSKQSIELLGNAKVRWLDCGRNGQPAIPRNKGIAAASGDWIAFLDSDDEWLPTKLEMQMKAVAETPHLAICSNAMRICKGHSLGNYLNRTATEITFAQLLKINEVICSSMLVKKKVLQQTGTFPEAADFIAIEDYALWLKVAACGTITFLPHALLNYTDEPAQSIRSGDKKTNQQRLLVLANTIQWLETCSLAARLQLLNMAREELELEKRNANPGLKLKAYRLLNKWLKR